MFSLPNWRSDWMSPRIDLPSQRLVCFLPSCDLDTVKVRILRHAPRGENGPAIRFAFCWCASTDLWSFIEVYRTGPMCPCSICSAPSTIGRFPRAIAAAVSASVNTPPEVGEKAVERRQTRTCNTGVVERHQTYVIHPNTAKFAFRML